ncbi:MAG: ORF6N domain-containing protein [Prolixibacteraceae bacterium]|nr:ORF6N domain-containing protein [Prolixibacteraceae bacterium]
MSENSKHIILSDEVIMNKIYVIRKQKVMIDRDLAELYGVETRALNQAVRRNPRLSGYSSKFAAAGAVSHNKSKTYYCGNP